MNKPTNKKKTISKEVSADDEMYEYGISRVPMHDQFQYGTYQYTSLTHAIAEAKREQLKASQGAQNTTSSTRS